MFRATHFSNEPMTRSHPPDRFAGDGVRNFYLSVILLLTLFVLVLAAVCSWFIGTPMPPEEPAVEPPLA